MFSVAVGWLGWSPQVAWTTPLPELFLAMDAWVEWARMPHPLPCFIAVQFFERESSFYWLMIAAEPST